MSKYEFKLPDIGEGVTEGEIVKWLVGPGDVVREDQPMVEVMTDKATVTITAPKSGKILETRAAEGNVVPVHSVLVVFDLGGDAPAAAAPPASARQLGGDDDKAGGPAATAVGDIREDLPGMSLLSPAAPATARVNGHGAGPAGQASYWNAKPLATPATRKLARDLGVDLRAVPPSGPHGRVTKDDVRLLVVNVPAPAGSAPAKEARPAAPAASPAPARAPMAIARPSAAGESLEERLPLRGMRKRIFEQMSRSKQTAAHFTFVEECDVTSLKALRDRLRPQAEASGVKLNYLPFIAKATVAALRKHPSLNSAFDESTQEIVVRRDVHLGIAASTDAGLVVPVVRNADRLSILDVAREIARLGEEAKAGRSRPEDLGGSTFTITSLGAQGGLFATPILNFPEVGILGVHQIKQKPVVRNGELAVGDVMLLSLSFDHRIIDGHVGAAFAYEIIGFLENPDRLFLEMA